MERIKYSELNQESLESLRLLAGDWLGRTPGDPGKVVPTIHFCQEGFGLLTRWAFVATRERHGAEVALVLATYLDEHWEQKAPVRQGGRILPTIIKDESGKLSQQWLDEGPKTPIQISPIVLRLANISSTLICPIIGTELWRPSTRPEQIRRGRLRHVSDPWVGRPSQLPLDKLRYLGEWYAYRYTNLLDKLPVKSGDAAKDERREHLANCLALLYGNQMAHDTAVAESKAVVRRHLVDTPQIYPGEEVDKTATLLLSTKAYLEYLLEKSSLAATFLDRECAQGNFDDNTKIILGAMAFASSYTLAESKDLALLEMPILNSLHAGNFAEVKTLYDFLYQNFSGNLPLG